MGSNPIWLTKYASVVQRLERATYNRLMIWVQVPPEAPYAGVVEQVDTTDLKSVDGKHREGSNPFSCTILQSGETLGSRTDYKIISGCSSEAERWFWEPEAEISKFSTQTTLNKLRSFIMARTSSKNVKTIPASEVLKVTCFTKPNESGDKYLITQNPLKEQFTLWKCLEDGFEKIKTSNNPLDFDDVIPWEV